MSNEEELAKFKSGKIRLHPCTPRHVEGMYEKGRWCREQGFKISDCPYQGMTDWYQEWCIGWLDEDQENLTKAGLDNFVDWDLYD